MNQGIGTVERLAGRRVVLGMSGGKDSAAASLWLTEQGVEHDRVFLDTGWEAAETYEHLDYLEGRLGPIVRVRGDYTMESLCEKKGMFPSRTRRFCTEELKVKPLQKYLAERMDAGDDVVSAVGIRAGESEARSKLAEWEWSNDFDCEVWRPLIRWTEQDVIDIHTRHRLRPNPLYLLGTSRVGCLPCIFARKAEVRLIAEKFPEQIVRIRKLEQRVGGAAWERFLRDWRALPIDDKVNARANGGGPANWNAPTLFQASGRDANKKRPCIPIDAVVSWAKTSRGGYQFELFAGGAAEEGCMRWGLCETASPDGKDTAT